MAKMFYNIEEAAGKIGVSADEIKQMVKDGKLQQFRDRDKLMFKVDQIDGLAANAQDTTAGSVAGETAGDTAGGSIGDSSGPIPLVDAGDSDMLGLGADDTAEMTPVKAGDQSQTSGVSVFDADEVEPADPMAQTQVSAQDDDEELSLESVGSGSGLLDLTRESDDTSLGAELLDEISGGSGMTDTKMGSGIGSSGVFESAIAAEVTDAGLESPSGGVLEESIIPGAYAGEAYDGPGSGMSTGMLLGAAASLIIGLIVAISALIDVPSALTGAMAETNTTLWMWLGIMAAASIVLGAIGFFIGKAQG